MEWIGLQLIMVAIHVKAIVYTATHLLIVFNVITLNPTRILLILLACHAQCYNMAIIFSKVVSIALQIVYNVYNHKFAHNATTHVAIRALQLINA